MATFIDLYKKQRQQSRTKINKQQTVKWFIVSENFFQIIQKKINIINKNTHSNTMSSRRQQSHDANSFNVFIRIRPFNDYELNMASNRDYITYSESQISVKNRNQNHTFTFDKIYHPITTQQEIFQTVADDIIDNAFLGINGTIFCYGQTASGKTHTIVGDYSSQFCQNQGLIPRILRQVVQRKNTKISNIQQSKLDIRIKVSMIEILNEKILDLLDLNKKDLKMRENKKKGVFIQNMTQKYIANAEEAINYVKLGLQNRTVGRTNLNAYSSRSHMVFIITIHETNFQTREAKSAKITLTDLAGSEKLSKTGVEGKMLIEAKKINTSLSTLGKVIQALSERLNHVPYRDSKLTRLLQQSIGGNSLTRLIINISPSYINDYETITSLRFGQRAKMIKNKPKVNKEYTVEELLILLEKAELKIKQQMKIIEELQQRHSSHFSRRNGGFAGLGYERSITMHMIGDDDEYYDDSSSVGSQSITKSVASNQENCTVSIFGEQSGFFNRTSDFQFENCSKKKKLRKPNLRNSKSLKVILNLGIQNDSQLDDITAFEKTGFSTDRRQKKSVKIQDCKTPNEEQDSEHKNGIIYQENEQGRQESFKNSSGPNFQLPCQSIDKVSLKDTGEDELKKNQAKSLGDYDDKKDSEDLKIDRTANIAKLSDITNNQSNTNDASLHVIMPTLNCPLSKSPKAREKQKQNEMTLLRQEIKDQLKEQLRQHIKQQIKQEIQQKIKEEFKQEIKNLTSKVETMTIQLKSTEVKFGEMKAKYERTIELMEDHKYAIKVKDQHIAELKEKYKAKKNQINKEINKLKNFWQIGL